MSQEEIEALFAELIAHQRKKVFERARQLNGRVTEDDIEQPQDFPELWNNSEWQYEDGILAGYRAAHMAVRARWKRDS
jgi:hypothetical protein